MVVKRGRGIHDRRAGGDNVQILEIETMVRVSKEQMVTLSQDAMWGKILQELDQGKRRKAEGKWRLFVESAW